MTPVAMGAGPGVLAVGILIAVGAGTAALLILLLHPLLQRYALARPTARGLHTIPTPQGGGIAVLGSCGLVVLLGAAWLGFGDGWRLAAVLVAAVLLAILGLVDDVRPLPALPRLVLQLAAMTIGVAALPEGTRVIPLLPPGVERAVLVLAGAWFINLTNFMDGMDWLTVIDIVPVCGVIVLAWCLGDLGAVPGLVALGLAGGLLGFAPFNRPVARLFLGDVGSLPIGFFVAYGLFGLAGQGGSARWMPALVACLYPVADSGITLLWRLTRGERIWEPHRSHFYQVAVARGLRTRQVIVRVAATNAALAALAAASLRWGVLGQAAALAAGAAAVAILLSALSRGVRR